MFLLPAGKRRQQIEDYLFRRIRPALPIIGPDGHAASVKWADPLPTRIPRPRRSPRSMTWCWLPVM